MSASWPTIGWYRRLISATRARISGPGEDVNPGVYIPGTCNGSPCSTTSNTNQRRVLYLINPVAGSLISDIFQADDGANAEYNGLLLKTEHRFSNHYSILANYAWAHCISEADAEGDLGGPQTQNPYNRNGERGNCGFDLRGTFNLTFVVESPRLANRWANRLLGNWQLAPIFSIHTGTWFSVFTGLDNSLTGIGLDRPNVVGNPYVRNLSTQQWLNPSSFVPNALGTFGNVGSDSLLGPAYFNIDAAVSKRFSVREKQRIELRFEFFNLTNHVNFNVPIWTPIYRTPRLASSWATRLRASCSLQLSTPSDVWGRGADCIRMTIGEEGRPYVRVLNLNAGRHPMRKVRAIRHTSP